jgi:threonylcarbamoyladenosine tRNA methylthiotransferase MtaB
MKSDQLKAATFNLGCKVNHYETEAIRRQLSEKGFELVPFEESADVYIINTCTVTAEAARKSRQLSRRAKRRNPEALVAAVGCDVDMEGERLAADLTIGNKGKSQVVEQICAYLKNPPPPGSRRDIRQAWVPDEPFESMGKVVDQSETRAIVKIQDGCNNFCTYCAIPYVRGRVRSRPPAEVLEEVEGLVANGFAEIVLTGIHVCSYGKDFEEPGRHLMDLADRLAQLPGLQQIRFGSVEPDSVDLEFARRLAENPKACPHLHLSLQSGCTATLKRMNRRYTAAEYREAVRILRGCLPELALTTDVITGFPGESEADHAESLVFCQEIGFNNIHVFRYSPRAGTAAAAFPGQVEGGVQEQRSRAFLALAAACRIRAAERLLGQVVTVLPEQVDETGFWTGYTPAYVPVAVAPVTMAAGEPSTAVLRQGKPVRVLVERRVGERAEGRVWLPESEAGPEKKPTD